MSASPDPMPPAHRPVHPSSPRALEWLALGRLPLQEERLREPALSAHLERPEVLVPEALGCLRIGLTPLHELEEIFLGDLPLFEPEQEMFPEGFRKPRPLDAWHYSPKMSCASSSLSRSDSLASEDSLKRRARARKRSLSPSLVLRPSSMRSTSTRLALVFRVLASARTRFATRVGRETLWRTDDSVRFIRHNLHHFASVRTIDGGEAAYERLA